jgi:hypothetical protein
MFVEASYVASDSIGLVQKLYFERSERMKTKSRLLIVLMLLLAAFGQHTTAYAGNTRVFRLKGPTAIATFYKISGCDYSETAVLVTEKERGGEPVPDEPLSFAAVSIFQFDLCTETLLHYAYGETSPLSAGEFQVSNTLDWATLNTTVNVFDEASGTTFDLAINMTWIGTSPLTREHRIEHRHDPGCIVNSRFQGESRLAQATGSISDGTTNFIPEPSVDGILSSAKSGTVMIGCI